MARLSHAPLALVACLAALALVSAAEVTVKVNYKSDGGRKMLQTNVTACLEAVNDCQLTPYSISLGLQNNFFTETTSGWFGLLPGTTLDELCITGSGPVPKIFVNAFGGLGDTCPPTDSDVVPPGSTDSKSFCLHGEEPHTVVKSLGSYTDEETGATASTCAGLGSCYGEALFYGVNLPSTWTLPCTFG